MFDTLHVSMRSADNLAWSFASWLVVPDMFNQLMCSRLL
jgi:hypothetical protein